LEQRRKAERQQRQAENAEQNRKDLDYYRKAAAQADELRSRIMAAIPKLVVAGLRTRDIDGCEKIYWSIILPRPSEVKVIQLLGEPTTKGTSLVWSWDRRMIQENSVTPFGNKGALELWFEDDSKKLVKVNYGESRYNIRGSPDPVPIKPCPVRIEAISTRDLRIGE